jgi:hypothetical protein
MIGKTKSIWIGLAGHIACMEHGKMIFVRKKERDHRKEPDEDDRIILNGLI